MKIGDNIKFNIGYAFGEGTIENIFMDGTLYVKLTKKCKEFDVGTVIVIDNDEIVDS